MTTPPPTPGWNNPGPGEQPGAPLQWQQPQAGIGGPYSPASPVSPPLPPPPPEKRTGFWPLVVAMIIFLGGVTAVALIANSNTPTTTPVIIAPQTNATVTTTETASPTNERPQTTAHPEDTSTATKATVSTP